MHFHYSFITGIYDRFHQAQNAPNIKILGGRAVKRGGNLWTFYKKLLPSSSGRFFSVDESRLMIGQGRPNSVTFHKSIIFVFDIVTTLNPTSRDLTLILRRSRAGTVWLYTSTNNKRAARPKLYTKSLIRDLKRMYSRFTLVRISINL